MDINIKGIAKSFFLNRKERKERYILYTNKCTFGECHKDELHDCDEDAEAKRLSDLDFD